MKSYLQRERTLTDAIPVNGNVTFDNSLSAAGSISYDDATGTITFGHKGVYYVSWFVAQQTGLAIDGSNFAIVREDGQEIIGSSHVKIAPSSGFAVINAEVGYTINLVNKSTHDAALSQTVKANAGIAVFAVEEDDGEVPLSWQLGYIHAQLEADIASAPLNNDAPVPFVTIKDHDPFGIIKLEDNQFTLEEPGAYLVTWEVPVKATEYNDFVNITLEVNGIHYSTSHMPLPIGVLSGSAMLTVGADGAEVSLINTSGDIVVISPQTNIVITQITRILNQDNTQDTDSDN